VNDDFWESTEPVHSHSIREMSAGVFFPGKDCEKCRGKPRAAHRVDRITAINRETKTITISREPESSD
jgi:hypothetical protein